MLPWTDSYFFFLDWLREKNRIPRSKPLSHENFPSILCWEIVALLLIFNRIPCSNVHENTYSILFKLWHMNLKWRKNSTSVRKHLVPVRGIKMQVFWWLLDVIQQGNHSISCNKILHVNKFSMFNDPTILVHVQIIYRFQFQQLNTINIWHLRNQLERTLILLHTGEDMVEKVLKKANLTFAFRLEFLVTIGQSSIQLTFACDKKCQAKIL